MAQVFDAVPQFPGQDCTQSKKVFIGGLSWETTSEKLRQYFENYGRVEEAFVNFDRKTGRPRGFGFVVFGDASIAEKVVSAKHTIDRREVEAKKAVPKQPENAKSLVPGSCKVFVGGLPPAVDQVTFKRYFEQFGQVKDAVVMYEHETKRPRGFGFVTYLHPDAVRSLFGSGKIHRMCDKNIEVKLAVPKDQMPAQRRLTAAGALALPLQSYSGLPTMYSTYLGGQQALQTPATALSAVAGGTYAPYSRLQSQLGTMSTTALQNGYAAATGLPAQLGAAFGGAAPTVSPASLLQGQSALGAYASSYLPSALQATTAAQTPLPGQLPLQLPGQTRGLSAVSTAALVSQPLSAAVQAGLPPSSSPGQGAIPGLVSTTSALGYQPFASQAALEVLGTDPLALTDPTVGFTGMYTGAEQPLADLAALAQNLPDLQQDHGFAAQMVPGALGA